MLKIYYTILSQDFNADVSGHAYGWTYGDEAEYGKDWNGDVKGYLENCLDMDDFALVPADHFNIIDTRSNALAVVDTRTGEPVEMYWAEDAEAEAEDEEDE